MLSLNAKKFCLLFFLLLLGVKISLSQNKINSRLFYLKPPLYDSKSKIRKINFSAFRVLISVPKDEREKFYGEVVYKKLKIKPLEEFFKTPTINEIQKKIELDFKRLGASQTQTANQPMVVINPSVEIFYPKVAGFVNGKSFAKVRLHFTALKNDSLVMNNTYESFYLTNGLDNDFEGQLDMTVAAGINVTLGMALRMTLDQFYSDLNLALHQPAGIITISGRVTNAKTGTGIIAMVQFKSDSNYTATATAEGRYTLQVPLIKNYAVQVSCHDFITISQQLNLSSATFKVKQENFALQPIERGRVVSLKNVLFYMGTTNLLQDSYAELDGVVTFLKENQKVKIELQGHTDNQGDAQKNMELSQQRVDRIKAYLVLKGIKPNRISGKGFGGTRPIAANKDEEGRRLNRRVEFVIVKR
jgi:outer membrane protein OmpA-like peptidoglycan-associated protein